MFILELGHWGETQEIQTKGLEKQMHLWFKRNQQASKIQGKLTFSRLRSSKEWPKLKAKAACTRHVTRFALELSKQHNSGSDHDRKRDAACELLVRFYDILDTEDRYLSDAAKLEISHIGKFFIAIYSNLSEEALRNDVRKWKMIPKFHAFVHLCEIQSLQIGNPRFFWCYEEEDMQKFTKEIAQSCHPRTVEFMVVYKWVIFSFTDDDE